MVSASVVNGVSIFLLLMLSRRQGEKYFSILRFEKLKLKTDLILSLGFFLISLVLTLIPPLALSSWLWGDASYYEEILFKPIPWSLTLSLLVIFPATIALAELPTYFGFIMPALSRRWSSKLWPLLLPVMFLSLQHCSLPLIFDLKFLVFRGLVYLPFALALGIALYRRPSLMPFLAIQHGLLDALAVTVYFT